MRLHLLPLHHGVPHHLPCLLHYGRNYTSEEDRHQHRLSYHRLPTAHLTALAAHQPPRPTIMSPARHTGALDLGTRFQVTLHQEEGERRSDERAVLTSSSDSVTFSLLRLHLLLLLLELRSVGAGPEEPAPAPRRQQADQEPLER